MQNCQPPSKPRLLLVVNVDWFFLSHRLPVALAAQQVGYEVHIATTITNKQNELASHGLIIHPIQINRGRSSLLSECITFGRILRLCLTVNPDIIHLVTIKPVLFGGIAARLAKVPAVVAAISGLGFVFIDKGWKAKLRRLLVGTMYKLALGSRNLTVIFQNTQDRDCLTALAKLPPEKGVLIRGSGVSLTEYYPKSLPEGHPTALMACRLIKDKGVMEFVQAARMLKKQGYPFRFCLVGNIDPGNPNSLSQQELQQIQDEAIVEIWGERHDMPEVIAQAHLVVLPSYYGEGLPKVLIEAAACGRAVVTTDMPGCRDAILANVSGLLVAPRNVCALADAMRLLLDNPEQCRQMGSAGRAFAEQEFAIEQVVDKHLRIYQAQLERI
ncbi:glycosyltransferase family 4 protein [Paludibacterium purpuratum]|uniref:Glycosyltransferase involved in cell wall biosynthesis n=1 Tax=Paludibacterium purpuratum TaxID=1144873 RepID=A0A4R7B3V5_9NEIS|nr:glycosyltransferase family 4 protein [Paludibacterium purpuratum]TDR76713.1 glycosyltransferase involved in cell wall biosynthesis [Paludibacterium purpuratum]